MKMMYQQIKTQYSAFQEEIREMLENAKQQEQHNRYLQLYEIKNKVSQLFIELESLFLLEREIPSEERKKKRITKSQIRQLIGEFQVSCEEITSFFEYSQEEKKETGTFQELYAQFKEEFEHLVKQSDEQERRFFALKKEYFEEME
ncbi:hypothetical protein SAMN02745116_01537 [Pilibacter termitis]|uniref:Uncharacterized protein n=2 Tax=Pilibacter termitis TaxID=263852 RepID=A0A1T4NTU7_9ENTE|nr:hypothetical protein SAMN02745116_01537 [Pilibacter termitis]